ncbi:glycosyltransferase [Nocardiopsis akebiae]|uniref:Glycosyltransferase n=1 Tax=Nocardiopsis akebiae TaxID=2831968 RepID=A0ABX8BZ00_9ACTN|nr:glycosyltransferase [Nocardiopsis akebiae]QUX26935.1 glycosyltransferase [Nocardiopsis akebiae]
MSPAPRPVISVVVPTGGGRPERLRPTLACLAAQRDAPPHEVVVVVDADEVPAEVGAAPGPPARDGVGSAPPLVVVRGPGRGRAAARNAGVAAASAPRLVFVDDDVLVGEDFLAAHHRARGPSLFCHGRMRELPTAAALVAELAEGDAADARDARRALGAGRTRAPRRRLVTNALERAVEGMDAGTVPDVAPWLGSVGANLAVDRAEVEAVGGFDESFGTTWGCEDLELGRRLHGRGLRRRLVPDALGVHLSHGRPDRWEQHARNLERFAALHPEPAVTHLAELLCADGDPVRYVDAVRRGDAP